MPLTRKSRVVVGISGGVDSSVAAAILKEQGHEVIGVNLKLWRPDLPVCSEKSSRLSDSLDDARRVCRQLGIEFHVVDRLGQFEREVIATFAAEYRAGRTPNPCVLCNNRVKFETLATVARALGADHIATGHYARVERHGAGGRVLLRRGRDPLQDQSYFLFQLNQEHLGMALFPLGDFAKERTREFARARQLPAADKKQSQEICFVPGDDYCRFLIESGLAKPHEGDIVDRHGRVLGRHTGIEFFTVGQRRGLRIAAPRPLYVLELDAVRNLVIVGQADELKRDALRVERCNWIAFVEPPSEFEALAQIRHRHPGQRATAIALPGGTVSVRFSTPQRAVTPGQACVFYDGDLLLGGGWIT